MAHHRSASHLTGAVDPERWRRLEELCLDAAELDPVARGAWLDRECGDDAALRAEVDRMLQELARDPGFLERPLLDPAQFDLTPAPDPPPPVTIGSYHIIERLGRGGMGEVYRATREADGVRQTVAIKIVRPGMGTDEILERFRQERRILAGLDHPHIARLLDAGATTDGRPYFVMEAVDGVPVTAYCDNRRLGIAGRLRLFRAICDAVQHAHQRLVVHRDLKPGNILVSRDGVVKLLDFGIGKVLGDDGDTAPRTRQQFRLMTPEYAAPEQIAGGAVTTATDVYSLGVLLYELLTGLHPSSTPGQGRAETERRIRDVTPRRPSLVLADPAVDPLVTADLAARRGAAPGQLRRRLAGDLDTIVLMALRKEPERRYQSAAALADDLQRWLDGRPVRARPDTLAYRTTRFLQRNAGWAAAAAIALVGLVATTSVALIQARRVRAEAARVTAERDKALEVRGFLMEMFGASGADQSVGDTVTVRRLLDIQVTNLESAYGGRPALKAEMLEVLADGYDRLGLLPRADSLADAALALRRTLHPDGHPDLGPALNLAGWIIHQRGRSAEAEPLLRQAVEIRRRAGDEYREPLARSLNDLGVVLTELGRQEEAEAVLQEALEIRLVELGPEHRAVGITGNNLAAVLYYRRRFPEAVAAQEVAVGAIRAALGPEHQRTVVALGNLAAMRRAAGDRSGTITDLRELVAIQARTQGAEHLVTARARLQFAQALYDHGTTTGDTGMVREAEQEFRRTTTALESSLGAAHAQVGTTISMTGTVLTWLGRYREAIAELTRAAEILRGAQGTGHPSTLTAIARRAQAHWRIGERDVAIGLERDAIRAAGTGAPSGVAGTFTLRTALCEHLIGRNAQGDAREANATCEAARAEIRPDQTDAADWRRYLTLRMAQTHLLLGNHQDGDSLVQVAARDSSGTPPLPGSPLRILLDSLVSARGGGG